MRKSKIIRPNVVRWRSAVERTGVVTHYRRVRPDNNNKHATLVEFFQLRTLHEL